MKTISITLALLVSLVIGLHGQSVNPPTGVTQSSRVAATSLPADTAPQVVERGANHRIWQWETYEPGFNGKVVSHVHAYTELASGMHYKNASGQWAESKELIEAYPGGAVARQGQHQVIFANNLNSQGSIDMQTPDGKRLRSNILGLMYYDAATGDAVLIARLQDSEGQLISDNQVLYPNAFEGLKADVQYTYRRDGFEQDVILREQPPTPESFGMDSVTTELEVFTEFINPPEASVKDSNDDNGLEADQEIGWGDVMLGRGKAFNLGDQTTQAPVAKRYVKIQGRYYLLEKVPMKDIQPDVAKLPEQAANPVKLPVMAFKNLTLPKTPLVRSGASPMRLASSARPDKGYVLDYVTINSWLTNYTFQGDTTYYISGSFWSGGTNTFEGGAVLKFAANGQIAIVAGGGPVPGGSINWKAGAYRPVIFTAKDDNTVGESIGTGNPTGYYGNPMLYLGGVSPQSPLTHLRISYANTAIACYGGNFNLNDVQFVNCQSGFLLVGANVSLGNALFANNKTNFIYQGGSTVTAQNVTCNNSLYLVSGPGTFMGCSLYLTNCVFANVTNLASGVVTLGGGCNGFYNAPNFGSATVTNAFYPFQTVGAGSYYLTNGCNFLNAGTTNISATVLADLKTKTTWPPTVYSNTTISVATTLNPQAQRNTNAPDLGYHYDPIDCIVDNLIVTNATLTVASGTVLACYNEPGIKLQKGSSIVSIGTPLAPNWFVRYQSVVECGGSPLGGTNVANGQTVSLSGSGSAMFQFSKFACPAAGGYHIYDATGSTCSNLWVQNCEFWDGQNCLTGSTNTTATLVNNLFWRSTLTAAATNLAATLALTNNLVFGTAVNLLQPTNSVWSAFNNDFDSCTITNSTLTNGYNAYLNCSGRLNPTNANDIVSGTTLAYQTGTLGMFYQPTNSPLINKGSTTADQVGLYHFTTQTNQVKEANTIVDIGYHYVAVDANGNPIDTDGDGIPDYLEDTNGNGIFDAGDLGDWLIGRFNGLSTTNRLTVFTPLN